VISWEFLLVATPCEECDATHPAMGQHPLWREVTRVLKALPVHQHRYTPGHHGQHSLLVLFYGPGLDGNKTQTDDAPSETNPKARLETDKDHDMFHDMFVH
jgi:hypothetical protein